MHVFHPLSLRIFENIFQTSNRTGGQVQRPQRRVPAADQGGGNEGSLSGLASGHDEGISGQCLLLPRL